MRPAKHARAFLRPPHAAGRAAGACRTRSPSSSGETHIIGFGFLLTARLRQRRLLQQAANRIRAFGRKVKAIFVCALFWGGNSQVRKTEGQSEAPLAASSGLECAIHLP
ncbi:hypothetical protein AOLI_G00079830 [Acnodon oligacanthus]